MSAQPAAPSEPMVKLELQLPASELGEARAAAARLGMPVEEAMRLMLHRLIETRGWDNLQRSANDNALDNKLTAHGVSLGRLAEIAQAAGVAAVARHVQAGRLAPSAEPSPDGERSLQIHQGVTRGGPPA